MARDDPFAGIRLSEQTTGAKLDQRLFESEPKAPAMPPAEPAKAPKPAPTPPPTKVSSPEEKDQPVVSLGSLSAKFDLDDLPLYKASFVFTQEELEALEDLKLELRRELDTKVTKNDLVRTALHLLVEDYRSAGKRSYARRKVAER